LATKHVRAAWAAGIATAIEGPVGSSQLLSGLGIAFHTCCGPTVPDVTVQDSVSVHVAVGMAVKNGGSISAEFASLRKLFEQAQGEVTANKTGSPATDSLRALADAISQKVPIVVEVNQADQISAILKLQQAYNFKLVIVGGAEAHIALNRLVTARNNVSVLYRARVPPDDFEKLRSVENGIVLLNQANIRVGLTVGDVNDARNLRWEAGYTFTRGLPFVDALAAVTRNVADMFGVANEGLGRISVGRRANLLLFNGDPLSMQSDLQLVASGTQVECQPLQY